MGNWKAEQTGEEMILRQDFNGIIRLLPVYKVAGCECGLSCEIEGLQVCHLLSY